MITRVRDAARALEESRDGSAAGFDTLLEPIAELLRLEVAGAFRLAVVDDRTRLDGGHSLGADMSDAFDRFLGSAPRNFGGYDPMRTEPAERNRVFRRDELSAHESSPLVQTFYPRFGLARLPQLRVLVCDGPAMLGWVGGWREGEFTDHERRALQSLVPVLRRRLRLLAWVGQAGLYAAALRTTMDAIGAPAFLVRTGGAPAMENASGRAMLRGDRRGTLERLARALRAGDEGAHVSPVRAAGMAPHYLVVLPAAESDTEARLAVASLRWALTRRQCEVLSHLVRGAANKTIAAALGCAVRTVEVHVKALFDKAQCETRSEVGAKFWQLR